jgi:hypothetical protein
VDLIIQDDRELRRVERALAEFEARPASERMRKQVLLQALASERARLAAAGERARKQRY